MPCFKSVASASTEAEGAGYVPPTTAPSQSPDASQPSEDVMVDVSGCVKSNSSGHHVDLRKVSALAAIKGGAQLLAYPSGTTPMQEYSAPATFAALYPHLFPCGCGSFKDPLRPKKVSFVAHIAHCLRYKDRRFPTEVNFPFVCLNIIQGRQASFQALLQTEKATFPKLVPLLKRVDVDTLADARQAQAWFPFRSGIRPGEGRCDLASEAEHHVY
ncbi:hypothetical protein L198_08258 [Cryptococcus wingfieldii CBS 7118]|uniref:Uncharacterized protein n=1 Tax=Cryptococcus wingfieldii CBS 7118 TaxID=1295528 RepID=A0A1E3HD27_9TREE|nr:hypothetical protein L198_08258 [Cryptococcus wingfieldii CBS 7118]ODN74237.1 hypothetical protein L198_08258 [Cryptococcus wingfieldii CBS 7118]